MGLVSADVVLLVICWLFVPGSRTRRFQVSQGSLPTYLDTYLQYVPYGHGSPLTAQTAIIGPTDIRGIILSIVTFIVELLAIVVRIATQPS